MPSNRISARIILAVLAIGPVATVVTFFREAAAKHPVLLITLLVAWEMLLFIGKFFSKVYGKLQDRWTDRAAEWSDATLRRVFSRYPREYKYFLSRMHHDVDLRGLSTWGMHTLAMDEVFVDLSLMPQLPHLIPSGPVANQNGEADQRLGEEALAAADSTVTAEHTDTVRRSIWQTLDQHPDGPIAILGPPGSGKTTLLRHVTLALCGRHGHQQVSRRWRRQIPLLLFLREHAAAIIQDPDITLADVLRRTLSRLTKTEPPGWWDNQLDGGHCVVMLDGLDEVARREDRASVMRWVQNQIVQYPRNRFILTSRPFGFIDPPLITATVVQVRQFTDVQVETFVRNWYLAVEQRSANRDDVGVTARAEEGANKLLDRLYGSPALLALATNPLLLTMVASVHKYRAALPGSRAELYREICQVFLGKRQEAKELTSELSIDQKTLVLRNLAFEMMQRRIRDISLDDAAVIIDQPLEKVNYLGSPSDFLVEMEQTAGLIIERDNGIYAFVHLTFQEYLAAVHLAEKKSIDFLVKKLNDSWWREVTLLRVANADATPIVQAVLCMDPPTVEQLSLAADCIDHAREVDAGVKKMLTEALSWKSWQHDLSRLRLAAQVILERKLQHVVRSKNHTFICAEPVAIPEYHMFLQDVNQNAPHDASSFRPGDWSVQLNSVDNTPVVGVGPEAATRFVEWARVLGLDVRLPLVRELSHDDYRRIAKAPAARFWAMLEESIHGRKLIKFELQPSVLSPSISDFPTLLNQQLKLDTILMRFLFPPSVAADAGLSSDSGSVRGDLENYAKLLERFTADVKSQYVTPSDDDFEEVQTRIGRRIASHFTALAGDRLTMSLPDDIPDLVPESYHACFPRLIETLIVRWKAGCHWEESSQFVADLYWQGQAKWLPETDHLARLIRAWCRVTLWAALQNPTHSRNWIKSLFHSADIRRRFRGKTMRESHQTFLYSALADLYLNEWRIRGLLPLHEGLLLARE